MLAVFKKPKGEGVKQEHGSEDKGMYLGDIGTISKEKGRGRSS